MAEQASSLLDPESRSATPPAAYKSPLHPNAQPVSLKASSSGEWPSKPQQLQRSYPRVACSIVVDLILGGAATLFLVLAIIVRIHENEPLDVHEQLVSSLQEASQYACHPVFDRGGFQLTVSQGSTLFPIVFAAAVSRGIRSFLLWRLERGATVGLLDTLAGSTTVFNTIATQINLRAPTLVGAFLLLIWGLSPVGSQASLRLMSLTQSYRNGNMTLQYTDTGYWFDDFYDNANSLAQARALFTTSLLGPPSTKHSNLDTWGKIKVPLIEALNNANTGMDGWKSVPINATYSSLSGLYMSGLTESSNISTKLETSYIYANCSVTTDSFSNLGNVTWAGDVSAKIYSPDSQDYSNGSHEPYTRNATVGLRPRTFYYITGLYLPKLDTDFEANSMGYLSPGAKCSLSTSYVELDVSCTGRNCSTTKMRHSQLTHNVTAWTVLDRFQTWNYWSANFVNAMDGHSATATPKEKYLVNPDNPGGYGSCGGYSTSGPNGGCTNEEIERVMDSTSFSNGLTQLLNTYYLSCAGAEITTNSLTPGSVNMCYQFQPQDPSTACQFVVDAPAVSATSTEVIVCHHGWLIAIIVSSVVMILATILRLVTALMRHSGDLLFNVSTLLRDNTYAPAAAMSSTVEDAHRSRELKGYTVRLGDLAPMRDVGHVGVGAIVDGAKVDYLRKGRLFD